MSLKKYYIKFNFRKDCYERRLLTEYRFPACDVITETQALEHFISLDSVFPEGLSDHLKTLTLAVDNPENGETSSNPTTEGVSNA